MCYLETNHTMHQRDLVLLHCFYLVGRESRRGKVYHKRKFQIALLYTCRTIGDTETHQHKSHVNEQQNLNLLGLMLILLRCLFLLKLVTSCLWKLFLTSGRKHFLTSPCLKREWTSLPQRLLIIIMGTFKGHESKSLLENHEAKDYSICLWKSEVVPPTGNINYNDRLFSFSEIDLIFENL